MLHSSDHATLLLCARKVPVFSVFSIQICQKYQVDLLLLAAFYS